MTFNDLRNGNGQQGETQEMADADAPVTKKGSKEKRFTEDELSIQWTLMCNRMPQRLVGLAARLKNITPHITDYPNIEAVVDNDILLSQLNEIRGNIRATMRKTLNCPTIEFTLRLADVAEQKRAFTKREIFDDLRKKNTAIEKLRMGLGLELA